MLIRLNSCNSFFLSFVSIRAIRSYCNSSKFVKLYNQDMDGIIDINQIFADNGPDSNYFISGPPVMIKAFKKALINIGVASTNVLTDDWE